MHNCSGRCGSALSADCLTINQLKGDNISITNTDYQAFTQSLYTSHSKPLQAKPKVNHDECHCDAYGCSGAPRRSRKHGFAYSRYCEKHDRHKQRHGHPTHKMPRVGLVSKARDNKANREARTAYLAGREWVRQNKDSDTLRRLIEAVEHDTYVLTECWEQPSPYIRASSMALSQRWKWYRHHLLVTNQVSAYHYVRHQVGLLTVLHYSPGSFSNDGMKERFLATRFLQLKPLPKHGIDWRSKKAKQHEPLDKKTAKFINDRLRAIWVTLTSMTTIEDELPLLLSKTERKRQTYKAKWTNEAREQQRQKAVQQFNQTIDEFRCLTTGAVFGKTRSGKLKVLYRGLASDEQIARLVNQYH